MVIGVKLDYSQTVDSEPIEPALSRKQLPTTEELELDIRNKGKFFGALIAVVGLLAVSIVVGNVVVNSSNQPTTTPTLEPTFSNPNNEPDYSAYSKRELCQRFPEQAKKLGKKCKDPQADSDASASPAPTETQAGVSSETGYELMNNALGWLNDEDPDGNWYVDPFGNESDLVVGVLLDDYSVYPEGCAAWWFNSDSDREKALSQGKVNLFSENYGWWIYDSGPVVLVVANSENDTCFGNIERILELPN